MVASQTQMRLYLIRHGETVDNVAGKYAGSTDSALTVHGVLQARQLAEHFKLTRPRLTHIFASPLQRAYKTAEALSLGQLEPAAKVVDPPNQNALSIIRAPDLVEQDFGYYEGKSFHPRPPGSTKSGRQLHNDIHKSDPGFVDVESKEAVDARAAAFIKRHLLPLLHSDKGGSELSVAIVSHGILLSHLWRCFLRMLPPRCVVVAPEVLAQRGEMSLEHLGGFSNTGFLELELVSKHIIDSSNSLDVTGTPLVKHEGLETSPVATLLPSSSPPSDAISVPTGVTTGTLHGLQVTILTVNGQAHLHGIKRARGGIGRMKFDEGQKTIDSFFKRPKKS